MIGRGICHDRRGLSKQKGIAPRRPTNAPAPAPDMGWPPAATRRSIALAVAPSASCG